MWITKKLFSLLLFCLFVAGMVLWGIQIKEGLILTNMRNSFTWGLYIAMWAFFVGAAAGGLVVSSAIYIFKAEKLKPVAKIGALSAFLFAFGAMLVILPDMGRVDRIFNLILHPNFNSVLVWDVIVLSSYALISLIYLYVLSKPDIVKNGFKIPLLGTFGKKGISEEEWANLKEKYSKKAKVLAPVALILAVLIHTVTAWVLATQLSRSWWFGGLLAPTFIAAAVASGPAIVILAGIGFLGYREEYKSTFATLAKISGGAGIVLLFMYYNDFVVRAWWGHGKEYEALKLVFTDYLWLHITEIAFILVSIVVFLKFSRKKWGLIFAGIGMNVGILAHRLLLLPPAYNLYPFKVPVYSGEKIVEWSYPIALGEIQNRVFTTHYSYFPSFYEIFISVGIFSFLILLLLFFGKMLNFKGVHSE